LVAQLRKSQLEFTSAKIAYLLALSVDNVEAKSFAVARERDTSLSNSIKS
jgi:hypothetical protein